MDVHASARKHGVADEDIIHATDHALAIEGAELVIHAMPMRAEYSRLLGS